MKKEASNTFNKGLVMDFNPLLTPNNVLTNNLNGTLITYNGNEYVLQNDLGNGEVGTAKLPAGYVPVGIKEHGGIIYVASYNPLTEKRQVGSFPSPKRLYTGNDSSDDYNSDIYDSTITIDFGNLISSLMLNGTSYPAIINENYNIRSFKYYVKNQDRCNNPSLPIYRISKIWDKITKSEW